MNTTIVNCPGQGLELPIIQIFGDSERPGWFTDLAGTQLSNQELKLPVDQHLQA